MAVVVYAPALALSQGKANRIQLIRIIKIRFILFFLNWLHLVTKSSVSCVPFFLSSDWDWCVRVGLVHFSRLHFLYSSCKFIIKAMNEIYYISVCYSGWNEGCDVVK